MTQASLHQAQAREDAGELRGVARAAWLADGLLLLAYGAGRGGADAVVAIAQPDGDIAVHAGDVAVVAPRDEVAAELTSLREFLREQVAPWPADDRAALVAMLAGLASKLGASPSLSDGLHAVREALRERRALSVTAEPAERGLEIDCLHRVDEHAFYVAARMWERAAPVTSLVAVTPEGARVELIDCAARAPTADDGERVACYFTTQAPSIRTDGWVLETENASGRGVEAHGSLTATAPEATRAGLVGEAELPGEFGEALRRDHVGPALERLQETRQRSAQVVSHEVHGRPPSSPEASVIVPLFGRIDLLEHQLVQWAADEALRECELIYVLDSPADADHLRAFAAQLFALYELPFQVLTLSANTGVNGARNIGARTAASPRLLFLDSDVLPTQPRWLPRLCRALDSRPDAACAGPKLIYEDDAIQHAGLVYERAAGDRLWSLEHRFKGLHRASAAANVPGPVPALTGACMLVDAESFRAAGGFSPSFVQGDYEDSDLCLRLRGSGRVCWYEPTVELYHLEAQSYGSEAREANRLYNRWLHDRLWAERIEQSA